MILAPAGVRRSGRRGTGTRVGSDPVVVSLPWDEWAGGGWAGTSGGEGVRKPSDHMQRAA